METTNVLIFGSGGYAKEIIGYIEAEPEQRFNIRGVVSTVPFDTKNTDYAVRYPVSRVANVAYDCGALRYIMAVADPALKIQFTRENEDRWITYISHLAYVSPFARVGRGSTLCPGAKVLGDGVVEEFCTLNVDSMVSHDCTLGAFSTLSPMVQFGGHTRTGARCFFGIGAATKPKVSIAPDVKVSMGAMVRKDIVAPGITVYGDPAQPRVSHD